MANLTSRAKLSCMVEGTRLGLKKKKKPYQSLHPNVPFDLVALSTWPVHSACTALVVDHEVISKHQCLFSLLYCNV